MKRLLTAAALASVLTFGACTTTQIANTEAVAQRVIAQVVAIAQATCRVAPTVEAIVALINSGVAASATVLATAFCSMVPSMSPVSSAGMARPFGARAGAAPVTLMCVPGTKICGWKR
jgi:hypothetical protein